MKKRMNVTFFGICFLASLIAEAYCLQVLDGDLLSTAGIGAVVLITGYLFLDSIESSMKHNVDNAKFYADRILREETDRWNERYTELVNLQKATYSATKKNTAIVTEQMKEILTGLEALESNNSKELQRIVELQKKSMEGQKNALNMEIHYNRENTNKLIEVLREEDNKPELVEQLAKILELLGINNELLRTGMKSLESIELSQNALSDNAMHNFSMQDHDAADDKVQGKEAADYRVRDEFMQDEYIPDYKVQDEYIQDEEISDYRVQDEYVQDEYIQDEETSDYIVQNEYIQDEEISDYKVQDEAEQDADLRFDVIQEEDVPEGTLQKEDIKQEIHQTDDFNSDENMSEFDNKEYRAEDYGTEESLGQYIPELPDKDEEPESIQRENEAPANNINVTPIYDDPNKALTADEIAKLFASFGQ